MWELEQGYKIVEKNGLVCIDSYYNTTLYILDKLLKLSHNTDRKQQKMNERYLKECGIEWDDLTKRNALQYLFVNLWRCRDRKNNIDQLYFECDETIYKTISYKDAYSVAECTEALGLFGK